jgi:hypothetical protein
MGRLVHTGLGSCAPFSTDTASHTHTAHSLACPLLTLSSARPFSNGIFRSDGAPASLPPASSSLTHARRMDGFCNQNADQLGSLAGLSFPAVYVGVVECAPVSLPPASSSLTHTRRMDGFCNQNADQLGSLAGLSFPAVYVGVVECAPASPTHTPPPHTGFPMSAHLSRLRLFQRHLRSLFWVWVWVWDWFTLLLARSFTRSSSSCHPPFTQYPVPSRSLVRDGQTSPHMPRLVVPHSTCPSLSPSPPRTQLYNRSCSTSGDGQTQHRLIGCKGERKRETTRETQTRRERRQQNKWGGVEREREFY